MVELTLRSVIHGSSSGVLILLAVSSYAQQLIDPDFKSVVERPAYPMNGPTVAIDEAHSNFHTARGQYRPFADVLRSDGYKVLASTGKFMPDTLPGVDVLIIANAYAPSGPAFTEQECDTVRDWVREGGSLLLIADHTPYGTSAENMGDRFGVTMGKGWVFDRSPLGNGFTSQLVFSRENGLLGVHPLLRGRDASENVTHVRSFSGQSLGVPQGATVLLRLSLTAREASDARDADAGDPGGTKSVSVAGGAQGIARCSARAGLSYSAKPQCSPRRSCRCSNRTVRRGSSRRA